MSEEVAESTEEVTLSAEKPSKGINAGIIYGLLYERYNKNAGEYVVAGEVYNDVTYRSSRRYDFIAVNCWSQQTIDVVEIKISNADLRHEIEHPEKHNIIFEHVDYYYLAAPDDVINSQIEVIPKKWGLYTVKKDAQGKWFLKKRRSAMALHDERRTTISRGFAFSLIRALENQSAKRRSLEKLMQDSYDKGYEACKVDLHRYDMERQNNMLVAKREYEWLMKCRYFVSSLGIWRDDESSLEAIKEKYSKAIKLSESYEWLKLSLGNVIKQSKSAIDSLEQLEKGEKNEEGIGVGEGGMPVEVPKVIPLS